MGIPAPSKIKPKKKKDLNDIVPGQKRKIVLNKAAKRDLIKYQHRALFCEGSLVFAKIKGYRAWPAKIVQTLPRSSYEVIFFGTKEWGHVTISNLYQYCDNTAEIFAIIDGRQKLATQFAHSLTEIETEYKDFENDF